MSTKVYNFQVHVIRGPMTPRFCRANPEVFRTVQLRGDQTLGRLARAIEDAFDLDGSDHMSEFHFGRRPKDYTPRRYVTNLRPEVDPFDAPLDDFGLRTRSMFWYWFDFGDDWYYQVRVIGAGKADPDVTYPREIDRLGATPPQYPNWDEEWDDDEGEAQGEESE